MLQKRRERINERLRILQNLVPNGTKVDISTMLEEAVQYVKFLQLQIKVIKESINYQSFQQFFIFLKFKENVLISDLILLILLFCSS